MAAWTIFYGRVQAAGPAVGRRSADGLSNEVPAARLWSGLLAIVPVLIVVALNAGTGRPRSVRDVIDAIQSSTGSQQLPDYLLDRNPDGEIDRQFVDAAKLTELTGWQPQTGFEAGIDEAVAWYEAHGETVRGRDGQVL